MEIKCPYINYSQISLYWLLDIRVHKELNAECAAVLSGQTYVQQACLGDENWTGQNNCTQAAMDKTGPCSANMCNADGNACMTRTRLGVATETDFFGPDQKSRLTERIGRTGLRGPIFLVLCRVYGKLLYLTNHFYRKVFGTGWLWLIFIVRVLAPPETR